MSIQNYDLGQGLALETMGTAVPCHLTEEAEVYVDGTIGVGAVMTLDVSPDNGANLA